MSSVFALEALNSLNDLSFAFASLVHLLQDLLWKCEELRDHSQRSQTGVTHEEMGLEYGQRLVVVEKYFGVRQIAFGKHASHIELSRPCHR